jgi:hypothetical protein
VAIDWKQLLSAVDGYELRPGVRIAEAAAAEAALTAVLPAELRDLYLASDGVFDATGQWYVIWPLAEVVTRNQDAWSRDGRSSRQALVGFGDDGTGAPFCVSRDDGRSVFAWSAIDGKATLLADTAAGFWSGWVAGTLPAH